MASGGHFSWKNQGRGTSDTWHCHHSIGSTDPFADIEPVEMVEVGTKSFDDVGDGMTGGPERGADIHQTPLRDEDSMSSVEDIPAWWIG